MHVTKRTPRPPPPSKDDIAKAIALYGFNAKDAKSWTAKYNALRWGGAGRRIPVLLTFDQYLGLAKKAGLRLPSDIGKASHQYQMGRLGDKGNYEVGNCRFITAKQNRDEKIANGGYARQSAKRTGWTKFNHAGTASMAETQRGRTKANDLGRLNQSLKVSKGFVLIDPAGREHKGRNLNEFCKQNGLTRQYLQSVCSGDRFHYKGWTGTYVN